VERPQTHICDGRPGPPTLTSTNADAQCPRRGTEHHAETMTSPPPTAPNLAQRRLTTYRSITPSGRNSITIC
jgi:hypothetical protein